ncbi:MAG TPA: T9SS type A sorting domain-containing protein [Lacibacter sp.]|nr:T9SS type A sorting domain-containing protein [Lacibacter sp.]
MTITGYQPVEIGCEHEYTASVTSVPSNWIILNYRWQAIGIGSSGTQRYRTGTDNNNNPVYTTVIGSQEIQLSSNFSPIKFWAKWDGTNYPSRCLQQIIFKIAYRLTTDDPTAQARISTYYLQGTGANANFLCMKGIPTNVTLSGPAAVQKCCLSNVTYTVANQGEATTFDQWTWPPGWSFVSQSGNSITLTPDATTAGTVSCRVGLPTACPALYRTASIAVTRSEPAISLTPNQFPVNRICPNTTYSFSVNPVCGATDYTWQFPADFTITSYSNNKATANVTTGSSPSPGNVVITASFNGCSNVSTTVPVVILTGTPAQVPEFDTLARNYHCQNWYICRNGSTSYIPYVFGAAPLDIQTFTYTLSSGWYFKNTSNQNVTSITLPFDAQPPTIYSDLCRTYGYYSVKANNCFGSSPTVSTIFYRESECWCNSTQPYPYGYGANKPCLVPPTGCNSCNTPIPYRLAPGSRNTPLIITENKIYPNPASSYITIETTEKELKMIKVTALNGANIYRTTTMEQIIKLDASKWLRGIYVVEVYTNNKAYMREKVIVNQ